MQMRIWNKLQNWLIAGLLISILLLTYQIWSYTMGTKGTELMRRAFAIAEAHGIPCQTKSWVAGGTDAGRISQAAAGAKTIGVAAPVRYIHTPSSAMAVSDLEPMLALVRALMEEL